MLALTPFLVADSGKTTEKVYTEKVRNAKTVLTFAIIVANVVGSRCCHCFYYHTTVCDIVDLLTPQPPSLK